ncbi:MAG: hypothetical protein GY757_10520 [bacterium]|nr:hypothetical protein [bacterium]
MPVSMPDFLNELFTFLSYMEERHEKFSIRFNYDILLGYTFLCVVLTPKGFKIVCLKQDKSLSVIACSHKVKVLNYIKKLVVPYDILNADYMCTGNLFSLFDPKIEQHLEKISPGIRKSNRLKSKGLRRLDKLCTDGSHYSRHIKGLHMQKNIRATRSTVRWSKNG